MEFLKRKSRWVTSLTLPSFRPVEEEQRLLGPLDVEPLDNCHIVYWVFLLYGVAMLLPWNVFITASEYFAARFAGTVYEETFQSYFSTYFTITNLATLIYLLYRQSSSSGIQIDVMYPLVVNTATFGFMAITVETSFGGSDYFWLTLVLLVLTGATTSFFQMAVIAEASRFPPEYVQAVMSGQGVAGVAVAASSILSALAGKTAGDTNRSAFLYFLSALLVTVAALVGRLILSQQPFYTHQMQQGKPVDENETDGMTTTPLSQIIRKSSGLIFAVGYIFVITLMLFPTITSLIKSVRLHPPSFLSPGRFFDDDIFIATHFMLFNVGDWLGRIIPLWPFFRTFNPRLLALYSVARTAFIPLFLVCNIVVSTERHLPVLITSDVVYFVLVLVFSVTNGWISCVAMMAAPQQPFLQNGTDQSRAGNVMGFSLVAGLAIGGCLSFWARSLV